MWQPSRTFYAVAAACVPLFANALEPDTLFERVSPSCWGVTVFDADGRAFSTGSAVVIAPGKLITNCHVLKNGKAFQVTKMNISYGATLEYADTERDLCQIKVANFTAPAVEIGSSQTLRVGQKVYAIGNPQGLELTLSEGLISSLRQLEEAGLPLIQTTAPISPGSSGGGLFDQNGRLVGITTSGKRSGQNLNFAHPASWIPEIEARYKAEIAKVEESKAATAPGPSTKGYAGPLRIGDQWVYNLTDQYTNLKRLVRHRIDEIDGVADRVTFNQGGRIEDTQGNLIGLTSFETGEFDIAMPPGGWLRTPLTLGKTWRASYEKSNRANNAAFRYDLKATVVRDETIVVPAGTFDATRIDWSGFAGATFEHGRYRASVWYSKDMNRIIKFSAEHISSGSTWINQRTRELLELVSYPGGR